MIMLAVIISCGDSDKAKTSTEKSTVSSPASLVAKDTGKIQTVQQQPAAPAISHAGLNPAHGQPGHRCDIPVGSPLNSKPEQPAVTTISQPSATQAPATPVINTTPGTGVALPGLNPAHGQPGHRCDIAVGAPLNSKPKNK